MAEVFGNAIWRKSAGSAVDACCPALANTSIMGIGRYRIPKADVPFIEALPGRNHPVKWNTRQESNLRALGSKPNGDAGNPRLVYWLRRQESDLRGLRSERSWDASNPHLNNLAGQ